ncbi:MAG: UDP-N-acetylmuramoyl-tripeptide--D-alanyl-D-alanine ligase [Methylococcales bacterium]|jgi:UDP-N-acetylmuramoyl-tripeptide--D-alanyl-D-alanine ligase|nr:UDP-N-acetylmuramoyl-tripeptide--D-alanyl-D-alanine ligase [Methylococcales bacterium]
MKALTLQQVAEATQGLASAEGVISGISTDSRHIQPGDLFIALVGPNFDGHDYIADVMEKGAAAVLVSAAVAESIPSVLVSDTRLGLGLLSAFYRQQFSLKVAAVTGSNGKTTVKEMLACILGECGLVLKTQGNFNNDIGLPLTLCNIEEKHDYAVIEMGANHQQEIAYLSGLTQPHVAVITNAGDAHIEGFGGRDGVAKGKGEIFSSLLVSGTAVINADDAYASFWQDLAKAYKICTFGMKASADVSTERSSIQVAFTEKGFSTQFDLHFQSKTYVVNLKVAGQHNVMNALAAAAVAISMKADITDVVSGLNKMMPVDGRLQPYIGREGVRVLNDTYNANPSSLAVGLDVLMACEGPHWLVLGDMGELGEDTKAIHESMGALAKERGIDRLFAVGELSLGAVNAFGEGGRHFDDKGALVRAINQLEIEGVVILVKGSRLMKMETVVQGLCGYEESGC